MGKVYKEYEVPIPKDKNIICHRTNGYRVEKVIDLHSTSCNGNPSKTRVLIGYVASSNTMYPNSNYQKFYPDNWKVLIGKKVNNQPIISIGLKSVVELIVVNYGVDFILRSIFGTSDTNMMYDHAMFSFLTKQSSAQHFQSTMQKHAIFSNKLYSDSYFSKRIKSITETKRHEFNKVWVKYNIDVHKDTNIDLLGDGSTFPTSAIFISSSDGYSKQPLDSGEEVIGATFLFGLNNVGPLSIDVYPGNVIDYKGLKYALLKYDSSNIKIHKMILDRGYCSFNIIEYLNSLHIPYEIMLDKDVLAMKTLISELGNSLKIECGKYWIPDTSLFGVTMNTKIFGNNDYCDNVHLYFSPAKYGKSVVKFLERLSLEINNLNKQLDHNKDADLTISKEFKEIINIVDEDGEKKVTYDNDSLTSKLSEYGFIGIINHNYDESSDKTIFDYKYRTKIEQWIDNVKNELGLHTLRIHSDESLNGKIQLILVESIIYYRIFEAAKKVNKTVQEIIRDLSNVKAQYINDSYCFVNSSPKYINKFLEELGGDESIFQDTVQELNDKLKNYIRLPRRRKPGCKPIKKYHKPGVPKGTKRSEINKNGSLRKKPGRISADPEKAKQRIDAKAKREARRQFDENGNPLPLRPGRPADPEKAKQRADAKAKRDARRQYDENGNPLPLRPGRISNNDK